jgi:hypothetical protein
LYFPVAEAIRTAGPGGRSPPNAHFENKDEIELVKKLFPDAEHYAGVYDDHDLLTPRMILAHAVHLSGGETVDQDAKR